MERRKFIEKGVIATACTFAGASVSNAAEGKKGCTIKVLKCTVHHDLSQQLRNTYGGPCPVFKEDQEFVVTSQYQMPKGFCQWAWADIRPYIQAVWHGRDDAVVTCCTDGFRPVIFQLYRS